MKIATVGLTAFATLLLAACSGSPDAPESPAPSSAPTDVASSETSMPEPTVGNEDDPLCAAAKVSLEASAELEAKVNELQELMSDPSFITSADGSVLNAWGADVLELTAPSKDFYELGVTETEGDAVNADFVAMNAFVDTYTIPLATSAADAGSPGDFFGEMQTLLTDDEVRTALTEAPQAASRIAVYTVARCKISD